MACQLTSETCKKCMGKQEAGHLEAKCQFQVQDPQKAAESCQPRIHKRPCWLGQITFYQQVYSCYLLGISIPWTKIQRSFFFKFIRSTIHNMYIVRGENPIQYTKQNSAIGQTRRVPELLIASRWSSAIRNPRSAQTFFSRWKTPSCRWKP